MGVGGGVLVIVLLVVLAGVAAAGTLRGGSLRVSGEDVEGAWFALAALAVQLLLELPWLRSAGALQAIGWVLYALSLVVLLGVARANMRLPGVPLVALGLLLNLLVVLVNGGMPVNDAALERAGVTAVRPDLRELGPKYVPERPGAWRLALLDNRLAVAPVRAVVSVGDVAQFAGLFLLVQGLMLQAGQRRREEALLPGPSLGGVREEPSWEQRRT